MLRDPFFLFRAAEADPDEIGTAVTNHIRDARGFICWPSAEGWRIRSDDGGVRKFFSEVGSQLLQRRIFSPEEEVTIALLSLIGATKSFQHQRRTVDALCKALGCWELGIEHPDEGHAIGADQIEFCHCFGKFGILMSEGGYVGVRGLHGIGLVLKQSPLQDPIDGLLVIRRCDGQADDGK